MQDTLKVARSAWRKHLKSRVQAEGDAEGDVKGPVIGVSASFTTDALLPFLGGLMLENGEANPDILNAEYNQVIQTAMDPRAAFGGTEPDVVVLLWRLEDLADPMDPQNINDAATMVLQAIAGLRDSFGGTIIVGIPPRPRPFTEGVAEFSRPTTLTRIWHDVALRLDELSREITSLYTVDQEALIAELGEDAALDHRTALLYRMPYREPWYYKVAEAIVRIQRSLKSEAKKCLVLDCDNTIWGGVIGEDGVGGIELSDDMPGLAFREFQKQVVALRRSGVFIALNSKNNPEDVWEVFDQHGSMALKREDIATSRINWRPKSGNLKEIAQDLNIGLDALVFVDDSHFEVEEVRAHAPEVTVIQVPEDTAALPVVARQMARLFDRPDITDDDRKRVDMMRLEMDRRDLKQKMTEDEFLASLGLRINLFEPIEADLARVTQLINKTNQFNVTTRRYTQSEVQSIVDDANADIICATVADRFGDYGLVGVTILRHGDGASEFDNVLMSCRVLGRGVETSMISEGLKRAAQKGNKTVSGTYLPTRKNKMVEDLFERHGFDNAGASGEEEGTLWSRAADEFAVPDYLDVHFERP